MSLFRAALKPVLRQQRILHLPAVARVQRPIKFSYVISRAGFASSSGISKEDIQKRVLDVLTTFEKVNHAKLDPSASFAGDLGLDSLDAVEVVMAIEEEFSIEIPDAEADEIKTVQQAIDYIAKTPEAT